ncbi:GTP-binding protein ypt1 [Pelomyxa schiedti]|nr:GTP-binding protein ypt1 [Pelomyxa schiedti]
MTLDPDQYHYKLLILGDSGVGKTSLMFKVVDNNFFEEPPELAGVDFKTKDVTVGADLVRLDIWDTAGQERFRTITSSYYKNAHGVIVMYDATDQQSFENVKQWATDIHHYASEAVKILVANKSDLTPVVDKAVAQQFADDWSYMSFMEISCKTGANVNEVLNSVASNIHSKWGNKPPSESPKDTIKLDGKDKKKKDKNGGGGCCN